MPMIHRLRVRYNECDPQNIVFNANYLMYADVANSEAWRRLCGGYAVLAELGVEVVIRHAELAFVSSARFEDELDIAAVVTRLGRTSTTWRYDMRVGERDIATCAVTYVCVGEDGRPLPFPEQVRAWLSRPELVGA